jgi:hypothetical protein
MAGGHSQPAEAARVPPVLYAFAGYGRIIYEEAGQIRIGRRDLARTVGIRPRTPSARKRQRSGDFGATMSLQNVEERHPQGFPTDIEFLEEFDTSRDGIRREPWDRPIVPPLTGPHPLHETREEFLGRMRRAWDAACEALKAEGVSRAEARSLDHSEWLVRYQVLQQPASAILKGRGDASAVYHAVRALGSLLELPVRS